MCGRAYGVSKLHCFFDIPGTLVRASNGGAVAINKASTLLCASPPLRYARAFDSRLA
jgi:hypothetical protein